MKIEKVEKLNHARFRNFSWDTDLTSFCGGVNILFGWNGSGKTTFSKVLRGIENEDLEDGCTFKIKLESEHITETSDLSRVKDKVRVFNDDYVATTLSGSSSIPYIFFAGKEAVDYADDENKLEEKIQALSKITLPSKHEEIARQTAILIKSVTGINSYRKELTGGSTYASYDKTDFENRIKNISERVRNGEIKSHTELIRDDIDSLKTQLVNSDRIAKVDAEISTSAQWLIDNTGGMNATLQGQPIQEQSERITKLEEDQVRWIKDGVSLHFSLDSKHITCLFCGSKITNTDELIKHFSEEVVRAINAVDGYLNRIEDFTTWFSKVESPTVTQRANISFLRSVFDSLTLVLREKRGVISTKKEPVIVDITRIQSLTTTNPEDATETAYAIETHYVAEKYEEHQTACNEYKKAFEGKQTQELEIRSLEEQIRILKQKAKSTHEPASALNRLFKTVFPYRKIEIVDSDEGTGYALKRDTEFCSFSSLSEGERNFIALAYFIYSINDAQNYLPDDGIVVIDDPVSSLDKQAIFQIYSLIVNEIKQHQNRQCLILTHNLDFLGHLKESFRKKIDEDKVRLFSLSITNSGCVIETISPLLRNHRSDYYYVFSVLYGFKDKCEMEDAHLVVNLLRRWLETFLEFKFSTSGDFQSTLESACTEGKKITEKWPTPFSANHLEIYRFVSHGSHGFPDTESTDESILTNAHQRIQEVFQLVKILDPLHYKKLISIVNKI
ncbi:AAA family ATPase [Patescibacteria group bacterium]|nr:AAA family ATPase [Patescibacteria group bacterium]MBU1075136.1 AAA family ATPase [Patescibacteria group bacterium]MBU1951762.1 AAA family ATPase [Patescibacteria group bacterium]